MSTRSLRLATAVALACLGSCVIPKASFNPRILNTDVSGDLLITSGIASAAADLEALGMEADNGVFAPRADFEWLGMHMTASTSKTVHDGRGVVDQTLEFDGITIGIGDAVDTNFSLGLTTLNATWDFAPTELLELGLGFGVTLVDFDANITSIATPSNTIDLNESVPVPMLVGRAGVELGPFDAEGMISGLSVNIDGDKASIVDLDIGLSYSLIGFGGDVYGAFSLGYRSFSIDLDYDDGGDDVSFDASFEGPYFGLMVSI